MIYVSAMLSFLLGDVMMGAGRNIVFWAIAGFAASFPIPLGILLGGFLADYVFEPLMMSENAVSSVLHVLVGRGAGSGMAVMFLCTGVLGCLFSLISYRQKEIRELG